jgi:hypothetical protein
VASSLAGLPIPQYAIVVSQAASIVASPIVGKSSFDNHRTNESRAASGKAARLY